LEYVIGTSRHFVAFDRGYGYCGDLDQTAFDWLIHNCEITHQREENLDGTHVPAYHPIGNRHKPRRGTWFNAIRDVAVHKDLVVDVQPVDIASRKIRFAEEADED
jgi:hypothetical protein